MVRDALIKAACALLLIGFASGIFMQIELLRPGVSFANEVIRPHLITLHIWAMGISLTLICMCTLPYIRRKETWGLWAIWLGCCGLPILIGALFQLMLRNAGPDSYLSDTYYATAIRHAFGVAALLAALGGLTAASKMKRKIISLGPISIFAVLISISGTVIAFLQANIGRIGMPRRYIDYPAEFAALQLASGIAAIACFGIAAAYLVYLWRRPSKAETIEAVF
jgi:heme/copper-type cytochrome/quinol oxidase subunit 1